VVERRDQGVRLGGVEARVAVIRRALRIDPVNAAVLLVAERGFVGVALAVAGVESGARFVRGRVVLDDQVVPIADPNRAVGSGFRVDGTGPGIGAAVDVVRKLFGNKAGAFGDDFELADEFAGGFADEGDAVAVVFREPVRGVERVAGGGGVAVELVHLADVH